MNKCINVQHGTAIHITNTIIGSTSTVTVIVQKMRQNSEVHFTHIHFITFSSGKNGFVKSDKIQIGNNKKISFWLYTHNLTHIFMPYAYYNHATHKRIHNIPISVMVVVVVVVNIDVLMTVTL